MLPEPARISEFELETHQGQPFRQADLAGGISYLFFGFTHCPAICPTTLAVLAEAEARIRLLPGGERFRGLFVSVDPERDGVERMRDYLAGFSGDFLGLRGSGDETRRLAGQLSVAFAKLPDSQGLLALEHSTHIVLVGPEGRYLGLIKGPQQADTLVASFRHLIRRFPDLVAAIGVRRHPDSIT